MQASTVSHLHHAEPKPFLSTFLMVNCNGYVGSSLIEPGKRVDPGDISCMQLVRRKKMEANLIQVISKDKLERFVIKHIPGTYQPQC